MSSIPQKRDTNNVPFKMSQRYLFEQQNINIYSFDLRSFS